MTDALNDYNARRARDRERTTARKRKVTIPGHVYDAKVRNRECRVCGRSPGSCEAHHLVHRGRMATRHPDLHNDDNLIPLCASCHTDHHTTDRRVPRHALTGPELAFLLEHAGEGWTDRWYPEET